MVVVSAILKDANTAIPTDSINSWAKTVLGASAARDVIVERLFPDSPPESQRRKIVTISLPSDSNISDAEKQAFMDEINRLGIFETVEIPKPRAQETARSR